MRIIPYIFSAILVCGFSASASASAEDPVEEQAVAQALQSSYLDYTRALGEAYKAMWHRKKANLDTTQDREIIRRIKAAQNDTLTLIRENGTDLTRPSSSREWSGYQWKDHSSRWQFDRQDRFRPREFQPARWE